MYKMGVIGDKDSVLGFKAIGLQVFPVNSKEEAEATLMDLAKKDFAVIYIIEDSAKDILSVIEQYNTKTIPAIIPIPGNRGSLGIGIQGVKKMVEKAVGADILFQDE